MIALALAALAAAAPVSEAVTIPGPQGPLGGAWIAGRRGAAPVVIVPGSGPTDRDGNSPLGITAASYRLLAEGLAGRGIGSVRIDKRGMFASRAAVADANAATIKDYAADARAWARFAAARAGARCAWIVGHSEGGLVALVAAQTAGEGVCGVVLVSTAGRSIVAVMREQLRANPANAPILAPALAMLDAVEAGRTVDPATLPPPLGAIFPTPVQAYLARTNRHDPARLAASAAVPVAIVQGDRDLQVGVADARALKSAAPRATLTIVPGVNHVLKAVADDPSANRASYADPSLPVAPGVVEAVAAAVG